MKENENLLLRYPDLYGPIEHPNDNELNVAEDMENQIQANNHRIALLQNLNRNLDNSLRRLNETHGKKNSTMDEHLNQTIGRSYDVQNYFLKRKESIPEAVKVVDRDTKSATVGRPVPLFKLENEIDELEGKERK